MKSLRPLSHVFRTGPAARRLAVSCCALVLFAGCGGGGGSSGKKGATGAPGDPAPTDSTLTMFEDAPGVVLQVVGLSGGSLPAGPTAGPGVAGVAPLNTDHFAPGDTLSVTFTIKKDDGTAWGLAEMNTVRVLVSGPTFNYQRVLAEKTDVVAKAVKVAEATYRYTFATPIPDTYLPPLNDTTAFGPDDGELSGEALLGGTYTIGLYGRWNYTVDGTGYSDVGNTESDFLLGTTPDIAPREVVSIENCNQCHVQLQAHGGLRRDPKLCLLCHTAGSEDKNVETAADGTPGVSIEFKVMIHKLHNGAHLPSVLGVATNSDGSRDYAATPVPYELVGFMNSVHDYSNVGLPVSPSAYVSYLYDTTGTVYQGTGGNGPMPRDTGFSALTGSQKFVDDKMRTAAVSCASCHGDPDGDGALTAPAQGDLYKSQPGRASCGSCHDDIDWSLPYAANGDIMPANPSNSCNVCHATEGDSLAVMDAHLHPYLDTSLNSGIALDVTGVSGGTGAGSKHQAGDPITATFSVKDEQGVDLNIASQVTRLQMIVTGPETSQQWLVRNVNPFDFGFRKSTPFTGTGSASSLAVSGAATQQTIAVVFSSSTAFDVIGSVTAPLAAQSIGGAASSTANVSYAGVTFTLTQGATAFVNGDRFYFEVVPVAGSYTMNVPVDISFERIGDATGGADSFAVGNVPAYWGRQAVFERTALIAPAVAIQSSIVAYGRFAVVDSTLLALAVNDRVVLDDGTATEEYLVVGRIQTSDDLTGADLGTADHVWFTAGTRYAHAANAMIQEVTLTSRREGLTYTMATTGATSIDLLAGGFTAGNPVVVSYRTDATFGFRNAPGESLQALYGPFATGDSDDIGAPEGDWKGTALVDGTYTLAMWANRDFTISPLRVLVPTEAFNTATNVSADNTTYRKMAEPASARFLYGAATTIVEPSIISAPENCNRCHSDIASHGFGRRGLDTCVSCHGASGAEDGAKYQFSAWYTPASVGVTIDFRSLVHKIHMGKELTHASDYQVVGIFLGTPYPVTYEEVGFPAMPEGTKNCAICHGEDNDSWKQPADRDHPDPAVPHVLAWRATCAACHDSEAADAHFDVQTSESGVETCALCHGEGKDQAVELVHKVR